MLVSPEFTGGNLITNVMAVRGGAFGRCLGQEGRAPMDVRSPLIQETTPSTQDGGHREKVAICGPGIGPSPDTDQADALFLGPQPPESWEMPFYEPSSLWYILCYSSSNTWTLTSLPPASWPSLCPLSCHTLSGEGMDPPLPLSGLFSADIFLCLVF